jgi:hypothetical protein
MKFEEKLRNRSKQAIWDEYCGFLDLSMDEYMQIQKRLLLEQIRFWSGSKLGQSILKGKVPQTIEEFRQMVPLTTYEDYADVLLGKKSEMLPDEPIIWIQTTWKVESIRSKWHLTREACWIHIHIMYGMSDSLYQRPESEFDVKVTDNILYALAPLPYATGCFRWL